MAVISSKDVAADEARQEIIGNAIIGNVTGIPGIECARGISPLVMIALQRANNPFITNRKGFDAIGIKFDKSGKQVTDAAEFALAIMPKTAEVLVLLSCSRDELKHFAVDPAALQDSALGLMDTATMEQLGAATVFVSEQLQQISKARVSKSPEAEIPSAAALDSNGTKKKRGRIG